MGEGASEHLVCLIEVGVVAVEELALRRSRAAGDALPLPPPGGRGGELVGLKLL